MKLLNKISEKLLEFKQQEVYKHSYYLQSAQDSQVKMEGKGDVLVFSSNNYLGLSNHPKIKQAAKDAIDQYGCGTASVRFICGTLAIHRELEEKTAAFVGCEAATTYASCWNANEAVFPTLFEEGDILFSDELNHASIIDGLRLMSKKVDKKVYKHSDLTDLEAKLQASSQYNNRAIVTDGVFSMEGDIAKLTGIVALAKKYDAMVIMDDSHATGVLGETGRGTAEHFGLLGQIDIITGTYGKALGGGAGGFIAGKKDIIDYCVQRSRPQLFSNALPPSVAATALEAIKLLEQEPERVQTLRDNANYFREGIKKLGLKPIDGDTPIVPIIVGETSLAIAMSEALLSKGIFVTGFGFPVVPQGEARLRNQISAGHSKAQIDLALEKMHEAAKELKLL